LWVAGAVGLLSIKEDAGLYLSALAAGVLVFERQRARDALALLAGAVTVGGLDLAIVQPLCLHSASQTEPGYVEFWGQFGHSLRAIAWGMARHPFRVVADVVRSSWFEMFLPAAMLPVLSPVPLCAMLPAILLLGTSNRSDMYLYGTYYPLALLPFFLWGLFASYARLAQRPSTRAIFCTALLVFPLVGEGYEKFQIPRPDLGESTRRAMTAIRAGSGPLCVQTILFPHVDYDTQPRPLFPGCETLPGARLLLAPDLAPWPYTHSEIGQLAAGHGRQRVTRFEPGVVLIESR
jgi:hypothetical protein